MTTTTGTAPKAGPKFQGAAIDHYAIVKTTAGFDQLSSDGADESAPKWLTRCNLHGKTTKADNRKAGRALGSTSARAAWCPGCKTDAAKAAGQAGR
jgi:hypothetical protein